MAKCEEGYRCQVCGQDVEHLRDSDLYLRYVIGELDPELLHTTPERHIRCNPVLAQFIRHPEFKSVKVHGAFSVAELDAGFVAERMQLVSAGYAKLLEIEARGGDRDVTEYPLAAVIDRYRT